ncbi:MAG: polysaccharide deacetylase family protein [Deltaproteobacteria bacterium]|nr:polysaccharide deacetylase family protein [Deltaproteobacteria bacterium]
MKINQHVYNFINMQNRNLPLIALITLSFPESFIRAIYNHNNGRHHWNGKKACITISFDCDYPEDVEAIPSILKVLSKYPFKASFACVGLWIEKYPKEHAMILEQGHEIINHTYSHPDNELLNPGQKFRSLERLNKLAEVEKCHEICLKFLNYEPKGCRIPHFKNLFTQEIYGILKELNYKYSSSTWLTNTKTFGLPFFADKGILEFPLSTCPLHPFTVFDTWHSLNTERWIHRLIHRGPDDYCSLFEKLLMIGKETGSYLNVYIDPLDVKKIPQFESLLDRLVVQDDFWVATYEELLGYFQMTHDPREIACPK